MCGHGTIGVCTVLVETGMVEVREPETVIRLDTPAEITRVVAEHTDVDPPASSDDSRAEEGRSPVATAIVGTFSNLNERVTQRTRGRLDLGMLVSVGLVLWAGRQLLRGPVTSLSWTSALWYAHGIFRDYTAPPHGR